LEYSSRPHAVTVYRSGALVERRVDVAARSGRIVLPGLPLSLDDAGVAVHVDQAHGARARVASATVRLHARPRSDAPEAPDHRALREAREELARSLRQRDQLHAELQLLEGIPMPARPRPVEGQPPPPSPLQARLAFDGFVDGETRERHDALAALGQAIDELQRRVAELEDQIRRHQGSSAARPEEMSKSVHVDLHATGDDERVLLLLRYRVPACRWVPRYALRLDGSDARLELRAAVAQGSGEDWEGVDLTLSTALPQAYSPLPALAAARIGKAQPAPAQRPQRPAPQGAEALFADADRALAALPRPPQPSSRVVHALSLESLDDAIDAVMDESDDDMDGFAAGSAVFGAAVSGAMAANAMEMDMPMAEPAPAMAPPPSPKSVRSRAKKKARPQRREAAKMAEEAEEQEPMEPATGGWPEYGSLVLPDPFGTGRGRLAPLSAEDKLTAVLADAGVSLPFDVGNLLRQHATRAQGVARLGLPAGARAVRPSHFDHAVRAAHPVDVPSIGTWHTITLAEVEGPCRLRYIGVPREEPAMYRIATMANPCGHPLLSGPVEVYVDGIYVLTATLPTTGSGADVELGVGVEPALHVARNTRFEETRSDERVVAMRELHHHIAIELRNDLGHPVDVEVRERVPIPDGDAEVAVDVVASEPTWTAYDQEERGETVEGGHRWRLQLPARSQQQLDAHYVVRLYANHEVVGGDRREA